MDKNNNNQGAIEQYLLALSLILLSCLLIYSKADQRLDLMAYDAITSTAPVKTDDDVIIISVDEKSLNEIGQWPWRRVIHAQMVDILTRAGARSVAFDVIFAERDNDYPGDDAALAESINNNGQVILPVHINPLSANHTLSEILPIPELANAASQLGHVHVQLDIDGIARGIFLRSGIGSDYWPAFSLASALKRKPELAEQYPSIEKEAAAYVNVSTYYKLIPFAGPGGNYTSYSYVDVLNGHVPTTAFKDRTVLIGASAAGLGDVIPTPVSSLAAPMSGVEFHANALAALLQGTIIEPVPELWVYLLTIAFVLIPVLLFPRISAPLVMPISVILVSACLLFSLFLFVFDNSWFPPASAIIGLLAAYPLWSWQRFRHLNHFLNQELEKLNKVPSLNFRNLSGRPVQEIFLALQRMLTPESATLWQDGKVISGKNEDPTSIPAELAVDFWFHQGLSSWLKLFRDKTEYIISISWGEVDDIDKKRAFLHRLIFSAELQHPNPRKPYEKITARIARVQRAIESMGDMRSFIANGFERMPDAVMVTDPLGIIVFANTHAEKWLAQSLSGKTLQKVFEHRIENEDALLKDASRVLVLGEDCSVERQINGRDVLIQMVPSLSEIPGEAGMIMSLSDITHIKQRQREKNQLIDFLSHDVRSPLVSQLAITTGVKSGRLELTPSILNDIELHAKRSLNLSEQFLQITRAEQTLSSQFYEFDLVSVIENCLDNVDQLAREKSIEIHFREMDEILMKGNAELLERAFINLLTNAIKYSDIEKHISIDLETAHNLAILKFSDQGYGISEEELPYIFDRFRRQRKSEISGDKGAGLGLNFVKIVIEKHQGSIDVMSTPGIGTQFTVTLPVTSHETG